MNEDKFIRLLRHPASKGLSEEAVREIADDAELIEIDTDQCLHHAQDILNSLYLIVQGRLKSSLLDIHGNELIQRFLSRGDQFGALAGAQLEPVPFSVFAIEPSKVLRLNYEKAMAFGAKYPTFHLNLMQIIGNELTRTMFVDRIQSKPSVVGIIHQSEASRELTRRLLARLVELEDSACVLSDRTEWIPMQGVAHHQMYDGDRLISHQESLRLLREWTNQGRILIDVGRSLDFEWFCKAVSFTDSVLWCVGREDYQNATEMIKALQAKVPSCATKSGLSGCSTEKNASPHTHPN